ncbi:MAG: GNAT family N-acetyltransferase, partial [Acidobacteriota bacterium]|nr:GNAT family N-acetyltransferase [Acidobacteriota bacterium]
MLSDHDLRVRPLTPSRWKYFDRLFGERGACGGCWCMWWKVKRSEWDSQKGETNRRAMRAYVDSGARPGLIAFAGREPVGWIAVEPRKNYPVLTRSRMLKTLDDAPVWSITCFFVRRDFRNRGVARALIRAAVEHVARKKGRLVEAYP